MTRKKVKLQYISNDSARKATFKKRKKGLMKKVSELSTLCGIDACAIIYSPYDSQPEVWPSPSGAQTVLDLFKRMPEMEQSKKMVNQESFLRQRLAKANELLKKQRRENREKEITEVMFQSLVGRGVHHLTMLDFNDLVWVIDQYLKEIARKMETHTQPSHNSHAASASAPATSAVVPAGPPMAAPPPDNRITGPSQRLLQVEKAPAATATFEMNMDTMPRQQWYMDMMNPQEHVGLGGDHELILPLIPDTNPNSIWANPFLP